jgi:hypothetical protein
MHGVVYSVEETDEIFILSTMHLRQSHIIGKKENKIS